ncbi:hypothetical protein RSOLAG22IIIB_12094 [Rhizoctonia solani]|uniref:Uncharacterized protein n=1 Tax=Rhizoctonia solani TaxID=456999 RepID=A0A0K6GC22_9AGAM|nr:hypothetical protein RSOLAG22IIIB_12094 [Rhizoctonia solani]
MRLHLASWYHPRGTPLPSYLLPPKLLDARLNRQRKSSLYRSLHLLVPRINGGSESWRQRLGNCEKSLPKRIGSTGCFAFCSSASAAPTPPPPPMANCPKLQIALARRGQEKGEWDGELDEDGEGPRSDLDRALWRAGLKTPAAGSKISTGKTPTVPMESMTAFLEEMKTVKLKSRVGPTPKASIVGVEEDDNCDDVGNNTFAFRRQEDLQSVLERCVRRVV